MTAQARQALKDALKLGKPRKYRNRPTNGSASVKENKRLAELRLLERAGEISDLQVQPRFPLVVNGFKVCVYVADASFIDKRGVFMVEDTKSAATKVNRAYRIKNKLFRALMGFSITET